MEHITCGISFKWWDILCDYGKELWDFGSCGELQKMKRIIWGKGWN